METRPDESHDLLTAARAYATLGLPIIPLRGKVPAVTAWQHFIANAVNVNLWFSPDRRANIGLRTGESGYIVIDTDTEEAERWVRAHLPESPMRALSGNGSTHRYYQRPPRKEIRNRQGLRGIHGLDVRGHAGYIVLPPSRHPETGKPYQWLTDFRHPEGLPRFSPAWVYRRTRCRLRTAVALDADRGHLLYRARLYLAKIEPAVSGEGGHNKMFGTANKLARLVNYDEDLLWALLQEYNERCLPPFSERELRHKFDDALKHRH
jgi:hypothetical protein